MDQAPLGNNQVPILHVAEFGAGRPLLLLHGWPEFWLTWEPLMAHYRAASEIARFFDRLA